VECRKGLHSGKLQPCLQNNRLGGKLTLVGNTLAYYNAARITVVKCFIVQVPERFI
jgi:hypothetical protein